MSASRANSRISRRWGEIAFLCCGIAGFVALLAHRLTIGSIADRYESSTSAELASQLQTPQHVLDQVVPLDGNQFDMSWRRYHGYGRILFRVDRVRFQDWLKRHGMEAVSLGSQHVTGPNTDYHWNQVLSCLKKFEKPLKLGEQRRIIEAEIMYSEEDEVGVCTLYTPTK